MTRDNLFEQKSGRNDFSFNHRVAEVFDDMLARSVPCYHQVIDMSGRILAEFLQKKDHVIDLGCSTGSTLLELARYLEAQELRFTGIDNSRAMIKKASLKAEMFGKQDSVGFEEKDILDLDVKDAGAFLLNYTLQFVRPMDRQRLTANLYQSLRPGGVMIISEKIIFHDSLINRSFIDFYLNFKKSQGYSEIEITRKREALENVLIPFSMDENIRMLRQAGFSTVEPFFQWFNFSSFLAVK